jgi:hypothetical protein
MGGMSEPAGMFQSLWAAVRWVAWVLAIELAVFIVVYLLYLLLKWIGVF